jgi:hypothetical protein
LYYTSRKDINFWSQIGYQKFSSVEHLTSYILNSGKVQISNIVGEGRWDLSKLPQVQYLISKNNGLLANTQPSLFENSYPSVNAGKAPEYIYSADFWTKLIQLYIFNHHINECLFHLSSFDIKNTHQSLLTAIYCCGYLYFDQKSEELTQYINKLNYNNVKRIRFRPSLANVQALAIHRNIYYAQGNVSEARSCLLHITKMCYMLGLHKSNTKLCKLESYMRNLIYTKVLLTHLIMTKAYKINLNFQVDDPDLSKICYKLNSQLMTQETAKLLKFKQEERIIISMLTIGINKYLDNTRILLIFPSVELYSNEGILKLCSEKFSKATLDYTKLIKQYEVISKHFPTYIEHVKINRVIIDSFYHHLGILIFELGIFKSNGVNYKLIYKSIELCDKLLTLASISGDKSVHEFFIYLALFTCISNFKYLKQFQKSKMIGNISLFKKLSLDNLNSSTLLNHLLIEAGIGLISKANSFS